MWPPIRLNATTRRCNRCRGPSSSTARTPPTTTIWAAYAGLDQLDRAEECIRRALQLAPSDSQTHYNLAALLALREKSAEAIQQYREAIQLRPGFAEAHFNLGNLLREAGQLAEAETCYSAALAAKPGYSKAATSLAAVQAQQQKSLDAEAAWRLRWRSIPPTPTPTFAWGRCCRPPASWRPRPTRCAATVHNPRHVEALNNLGCVYRSLENVQQAESCFRLALGIKPDFVEALANLAAVLHAKCDHSAARGLLQESLAVSPRLRRSVHQSGIDLPIAKTLGPGHRELSPALKLDPKSADAWVNLGAALQVQGKLTEAVECHRRAPAIDPNHHRAHYSLARPCTTRVRRTKALAAYAEAIRLKPDYAEAHYNRWLRASEPWRFRRRLARLRLAAALQGLPGPTIRRAALGRLAAGGRTLLIHAEQGLGDTLQFIRYVRLAARRGGPVVVEVQPALMPRCCAPRAISTPLPAARRCRSSTCTFRC